MNAGRVGGAGRPRRRRGGGAVVSLIVDKAWHGFQAEAFAGAPLLDLISNDEALRALRILAVFIDLGLVGEDLDSVFSEWFQSVLSYCRMLCWRRDAPSSGQLRKATLPAHDCALIQATRHSPPKNRQTPGAASG